MGLAFLTALALLVADDAKAARAPGRCTVVAGASNGWTTLAEGRTSSDGEVETAIFVAQPPIVSVTGAPAEKRAPELAFISAVDLQTEGAPASILLIQISIARRTDEAGSDWTGQLLADGAELGSGRLVWDEAFTAQGLSGDRQGQMGRFVIDHPSGKLLEAIGKAREVTTIVNAPGHAPWTGGYGKIRLASVQSGQDRALDLMRSAAQGARILGFPDYASCDSGAPDARPARPLEAPSLPPLPSPP